MDILGWGEGVDEKSYIHRAVVMPVPCCLNAVGPVFQRLAMDTRGGQSTPPPSPNLVPSKTKFKIQLNWQERSVIVRSSIVLVAWKSDDWHG